MEYPLSRPEHTSREELWRELISRIEGVRSARVLFDEDGIAKEITVIADDNKNPKQLTRDIQSALNTTFEVDVDQRIINVSRPKEERPLSSVIRLQYDGMQLEIGPRRTHVTVHLSHKGMIYSGSAALTPGLFGRGRMVAQATVEAMNEFVGKKAFELVDIVQETIGGRQLLVAMVYCTLRSQLLLGSALVEIDNDSAALKAVLNASNRLIDVIKR
ncbi:MAG: hypothetical protein FWD25_08665 [Clostridia bacterium]|nr:hypothetical protein [Clostridia bacterium]